MSEQVIICPQCQNKNTVNGSDFPSNPGAAGIGVFCKVEEERNRAVGETEAIDRAGESPGRTEIQPTGRN